LVVQLNKITSYKFDYFYILAIYELLPAGIMLTIYMLAIGAVMFVDGKDNSTDKDRLLGVNWQLGYLPSIRDY
jgi:hypothetical protein